MNTRMLIAVVVSMFVCQQVHAQDEPVMPEATELEGTWEMVSCVAVGEQIANRNRYWRFVGDRWNISRSVNGNWRSPGRFSVDPSAMPAEIVFEDGALEYLVEPITPPNVLSPIVASTFKGIYEIDGDQLRICSGSSSRPDRFESSEDYPSYLFVFRRVDEDDE